MARTNPRCYSCRRKPVNHSKGETFDPAKHVGSILDYRLMSLHRGDLWKLKS